MHVKREGGRLLAPGISDNGTGLAALVALAKAFREAKIKTNKTILFVADVGEEGEGNLRGIRALVDSYKKHLKYVLALDGSATEYVTTAALASRRVEISITGPGGHSWSGLLVRRIQSMRWDGELRGSSRRVCRNRRAQVSTSVKLKVAHR